jgi:hypothetical protein
MLLTGVELEMTRAPESSRVGSASKASSRIKGEESWAGDQKWGRAELETKFSEQQKGFLRLNNSAMVMMFKQ